MSASRIGWRTTNKRSSNSADMVDGVKREIETVFIGDPTLPSCAPKCTEALDIANAQRDLGAPGSDP